MKHTRQAWHTQITQNLYSAFSFLKTAFSFLLSLFLAFSLLKTDKLNSKHVKNLRFVPARRRFDVDRRFQRSRRKNKFLRAPKTPRKKPEQVTDRVKIRLVSGEYIVYFIATQQLHGTNSEKLLRQINGAENLNCYFTVYNYKVNQNFQVPEIDFNFSTTTTVRL